jgi:hypothetical protein
MLRNPSHRTIVGIWLGWVVIMLAYQVFVPMRLAIARPDYALDWTVNETKAHSQDKKIYLNEPFLNAHVSWDSEFYLAIAVGGYEDPNIFRIGAAGLPVTDNGIKPGVPLSYAFLPFYPLVMRIVAIPLSLLGMNPIATATLAGVMVSMLGTLAAMLALYEMARTDLGEDGGVRAAFYLIIFPSGFFLAQVYTEGLFVGLAFSSLVLLRRGHRNWAVLLAVLATLTRAVGVALVVPLLISWIEQGEWRELDMEWRQIYFKGLPWKAIGHALLTLAPVVAFFIWRVSYFGMAFNKVETEFFGRGLLSLGVAFVTWKDGLLAIFGKNPQAAAYYMIEWGGILLGFGSAIYAFRHYPDLAWFSFLVVLLSFTSGPAQGMYRYILASPVVFLLLSRWGKNPVFERVWTIGSILIMGMLAMLFTFDMWTG